MKLQAGYRAVQRKLKFPFKLTGGQNHPGTGVKMCGQPGGKVDLEALCRATGIPNVRRFDPRNLEETEQVIRSRPRGA